MLDNKDITSELSCPLCLSNSCTFYYRDKKRSYYQCHNCLLVFVPSEFHLSSEDEKKEYDLHINDPQDIGYRKFLSRLADPLQKRLEKGARGLDFGCGPGPTLSVMLEENGYLVDLFDAFYFKDDKVFEKRYDFITATEVVEHLSNPKKEFGKLMSCLKDDGCLGIMTKLVKNREAFAKWHYIQDYTHISFYSNETFNYLAKLYNCEVEFIGADVIILKKY